MAISEGVPEATAVYVTYGPLQPELGWIPRSAPIVLVHNDAHTLAATDRAVQELHPGRNLGFGGGVNLALRGITTERVVVCNPDTVLSPAHWDALASGRDDEIVTIPQVDGSGVPTSVINAYPTPAAHLAAGWRLGRLAPRGSPARRLLTRLLGRWGSAHAESRTAGSWPLSSRWVSGAIFSCSVKRLRDVGGFDESYFLYFEDLDLCARLATAYPDMRVRMAAATPALHRVGGSSYNAMVRRRTALHHVTSAVLWAERRRAVSWWLCAALLRPRRAWLRRRVRASAEA